MQLKSAHDRQLVTTRKSSFCLGWIDMMPQIQRFSPEVRGFYSNFIPLSYSLRKAAVGSPIKSENSQSLK